MRLLLRIFLFAGACICALVSFWMVVCIFSVWFVGPPQDPSMAPALNILIHLGMTVLLIGLSFLFARLARDGFIRAQAAARN
jgi:hypothetical protein